MQSIVLPLRASESGVGWKHRRLRLGLIRRGALRSSGAADPSRFAKTAAPLGMKKSERTYFTHWGNRHKYEIPSALRAYPPTF